MKIGSLKLDNRVFLAPMAGITDLPYRIIMKRFGAGMVYSEMVSAKGLLYSGARTRELLNSRPEERPLAIQLFGSEPTDLAEAVKSIRTDCELIDLNLGCPVNKVVRSGAGSALLKDPGQVQSIVREVRAATDLPLTIKIRSGWDQQTINFLEIGKIAEGEGVDAITLPNSSKSMVAPKTHAPSALINAGLIICALDSFPSKSAMRPSTNPCFSLAASYSAFSERSP